MYEFEQADERKRNERGREKNPLGPGERLDEDAPRKLFAGDDDDEPGRPLNVNQAKLEFEYRETDEDIVVAAYLYKVGGNHIHCCFSASSGTIMKFYSFHL